VQPQRLVTLKEAAALSGLSYAHLRLLARTGKLQAWRIGHQWLTTPEAVAAYLHDPEKRSHDPLKHRRAGNSNQS
jgi:excisionase family DNA binding protein